MRVWAPLPLAALMALLPHRSAGDATSALDPTSLLPSHEVARSTVLVPGPSTTGGYPTGRRLRGDFEPSDTLLVAYSGYWEDALDLLIEAAEGEADVFVLVPGEEKRSAKEWIETNEYSHVRMIDAHLDTPWIRDYGPLQVTDLRGRTSWLDAGYSGARPSDDRLPTWLGRKVGVKVERIPITLDGGGIITNGRGLCVITNDTLEDTGITGFDVAEHDRVLRKLGCTAMAVVPALAYEPTGHVDMFAQFVSPTTVLLAAVDPGRWEEEHVRLEEVRRGIEAAAGAAGVELEIVRVPMPMPAHDRYRPYVNGLRLGRSFLVPSYGDVDPAVEHAAFDVLAASMPDVRVVPIPADRMIELEGAIHCVAQGLSLSRTPR